MIVTHLSLAIVESGSQKLIHFDLKKKCCHTVKHAKAMLSDSFFIPVFHFTEAAQIEWGNF